MPEDAFFVVIGVWEIIIGIGLLVPVLLRLTLALFWLQMAGTFLSLIVLPDRAFQDGNPLLLDVTGEFIVKNLVLIAAGLVIGSTVRRRRTPEAQTYENVIHVTFDALWHCYHDRVRSRRGWGSAVTRGALGARAVSGIHS